MIPVRPRARVPKLRKLAASTCCRGPAYLITHAQFSYDGLDRTLTAVDDDYQVEMTWDSVGNLLKDRQGYNSQGQEQWMTGTTGSFFSGLAKGMCWMAQSLLSVVR